MPEHGWHVERLETQYKTHRWIVQAAMRHCEIGYNVDTSCPISPWAAGGQVELTVRKEVALTSDSTNIPHKLQTA
jgi:hypothetical protein